jgi:DNA-binding response OmpR family regulator
MPEILLIDDSPTQLSVRETVLQEAGFSITTASTADEALGLLRDPGLSKSLRLIVTDHMMPGVSGDAFVRKLRATGATMPVIVISGLAEAQEEYEGLDVRFLNKPCPPEELIAAVGASLGRKQ